MDVVLERIRNETIPHPDPRLPLMMQPAVHPEKFVHRGVEVGIMRELNVPANIPGEALVIDERRCQTAGFARGFQQTPGGTAIELQLTSRAEPGWTGTNDQVMSVHQREDRSETVIPEELPPQPIFRSSSSQRVDGELAAFLLFRMDHSRNDLCKADPWSPAELPCRLRGVAPRIANVSGASERIIAFDVVLPSQSNFGKRGGHEFIQPVGCTRSNNKILGPIVLQHHPHRFDVVRGPAPVAMY